MGCTTMTYPTIEGKIIKQEKIELDISNINKGKELSQAQIIINLITNLRNKIIYDLDHLIYVTGACIFKNPNIIHCVKCLFFLISSECEGILNNAEFVYKEDPPFFNINKGKITEETQNILNEFLEFIINLKDYRVIINQLDKELPRLMYILFENNNNISKENLNKIQKAINLFQDLSKMRNNILRDYKNQIYDLMMSNSNFCKPINIIGKLSLEKKIKDKYEIAFLFNQLKDDQDFIRFFRKEEMALYKNINEAKEIMEKKLRQEKMDYDDKGININNYGFNKLNYSSSLSGSLNTLTSSYKMNLPNS